MTSDRLFAVADGIGGPAHGEVASRLALDTLGGLSPPMTVFPVCSTAVAKPTRRCGGAERAHESARPDRLFDDALAGDLAGPEGRTIMAEMTAGMPDNPAIPIRTRYFDDRVPGPTQVVLVAAGMDTRAFRLGLAADVTVFELDKPALLAVKLGPYLEAWLAKLAAAGMRRRFATDDPEDLFATHGWVAEVVEYGHETANFGRWPWPPVERNNANWPHNFLVRAHRRS